MSRTTIVVADDHADVRSSLSVLLAGTDLFDVVGEAATGREAIHVCRERRPDVLLLDLSMPVMDGFEALPILRHASPDTKIIVYSGQDGRETRRRVLDLGAAGFIEKDGAVLGVWKEILDVLDLPAPEHAAAPARGASPVETGRQMDI